MSDGSADDAPALATDGVLARWLAALHGRGDRAAIERALTEDICIERYAPAPEEELGRGEPLERFVGYDEVARWLARTPEQTVFSLASAPRRDGDLVVVDYALEVEEFRNGGRWHVRIRDERLAWIAHHPRALRVE